MAMSVYFAAVSHGIVRAANKTHLVCEFDRPWAGKPTTVKVPRKLFAPRRRRALIGVVVSVPLNHIPRVWLDADRKPLFNRKAGNDRND